MEPEELADVFAKFRHQIKPETTDSTDTADEMRPAVVSNPCALCGKESTIRCPYCKTPYCHRDCQTKDWKLHKEQCKKHKKASKDKNKSRDKRSSREGSRAGSEKNASVDEEAKQDARLRALLKDHHVESVMGGRTVDTLMKLLHTLPHSQLRRLVEQASKPGGKMELIKKLQVLAKLNL